MDVARPSPAFLDLADVKPDDWRRELLAAAAVALMAVPQGIAYAVIAGLPPAMGLYASAVPAMVAALLRSSRLVVVGPTNAVSLLFAASVAVHMDDPVAAAGTLALMVGILQIGAGLMQLGSLVDYISAAVVTGYVTGATTLIAAGQLPNLTGTVAQGGDIFTRLISWVGGLGEIDPVSVSVGAATIALVMTLRQFMPRGAPMLIALVVATAASWAFGFDRTGVRVIRDLGAIPWGLPPISLPGLGGLILLFPVAMATAVLSLVESTSLARTLASKTGQRFDVTTDIVGLGAANLAAAVFGGIPVSGSMSRSSLGHQLGARTRLVGLVSGLLMFLVFFGLGPFLDQAPIPAVAAIIAIIAMDMVDLPKIAALLNSGSTDRVAFVGTVLGAWILPLDQAIFVGVGISIVLFLRRARLLVVRELRLGPDRQFHELPIEADDPHTPPCSAIRVLHIEGPLFFGAAGELESALFELIDDPSVHVLVVRLKRAHGIDYTTAAVLEHAHAVMAKDGRHLMLVGMRQDVMERLEAIGIADAFDDQELYPTEPGWFAAMNHALARALELVETEHAPHTCPICPMVKYIRGTPAPEAQV
jgi:SulP family sulfate permease